MKLFVFLLIISTSCLASDFAKEKRWADEIVDSIMDGEATELKAGNHDFLSIFTEADPESIKGMIVVHGTGIHPNWDQVIRPIRVQMASKGWNTLSIQMPVKANDAKYEDYIPLYPQVPGRLKAAEDFLLNKGIKQIVIVAHSQGASMAAYYLANQDSRAKAFIAIGMPARHTDKPEATKISAATTLKLIKIPVLDLYGSEDLENVLTSIKERKSAAAGNKEYSQQKIPKANHFFDGKNAELVSAVNQWLQAK